GRDQGRARRARQYRRHRRAPAGQLRHRDGRHAAILQGYPPDLDALWPEPRNLRARRVPADLYLMPARRDLLAAGVALPLLAAYPARAGIVRHRSVRVAAPFDMPAIEMPDFGAVRGFPITEYGAAPAH